MKKILKPLKLLLPAIIPSWRFFDGIAPSPRVQYTLLSSQEAEAEEWLEFRPRPYSLSFSHMLKRMFWNPQWNETLFLVSCAERLIVESTRHSEEEILQRIRHELRLNKNASAAYLQFRLVFVKRQNQHLEKTVLYCSSIVPLDTRPSS